MKEVHEYCCSSYYVFESLASARSCYFESEEEMAKFKVLFFRYIGEYVHVHRMYMSSEGYQVTLKVRSRKYIRKLYMNQCEKRGRVIDVGKWENPWKIVSEQFRIFHSVYAKAVNKLRGRKGVLVQRRFQRRYFESLEECERYEKEMGSKKEIEGQRDERYRVSERWKKGIRWWLVRSRGWVERYMDKVFQGYVVHKLVVATLKAHAPPP